MGMEVLYRAEVIGSLLRPPEVKQAMHDAVAGKISPPELHRIQDVAVLDAIALQESCGLDVITDGEYRRAIFWDPIIAALDGLSVDAASPVSFGGSGTEDDLLRLPAVTGSLVLRDSLLQRELRFLVDHTASAVKATMPAMA
jgi:5-methyltetrahydropteroyltriglutamate--homocysteine methyltransferase